MIINTSYFLNKNVFIPNAVAQPSIGSNTPTSIIQLQAEIDERENELLLSFLGYEQTEELLDQFEQVSPSIEWTWKESALQKWKDLVDGLEEWKGLRYTIGTQKISLIAYYMFFYYLKSDYSTYSTTGIQIAKSENSISQLPNEKQVSAWNKFVNMYDGGNISQRNYNFSRNWNGLMLRWNTGERNNVSLYDFMSSKSDVYDLSFFNHYDIINSMNL